MKSAIEVMFCALASRTTRAIIAARYGKRQAVAATVALIAIIGTIPYIALQLKAVSPRWKRSWAQVHADGRIGRPVLGDIALFVALLMATSRCCSARATSTRQSIRMG